MLRWLTAVMLLAGAARAAVTVTVVPYFATMIVGYPCAFRVTLHNSGATDAPISGGGGWSASVSPTELGSASTSSGTLPGQVPAGGDVTLEAIFYPIAAGYVTITVSVPGMPTGTLSGTIWSADSPVVRQHAGSGGMEIRHNIIHVKYGNGVESTGYTSPALVLLHGPPGGKVQLAIAGPTGHPLGDINRTFYVIGLDSGSTVTLNDQGNGLCNIAGSANGTSLGTGMFWVMASGAVVARKPLMVVSYK
jgi:hypothetical protein